MQLLRPHPAHARDSIYYISHESSLATTEHCVIHIIRLVCIDPMLPIEKLKYKGNDDSGGRLRCDLSLDRHEHTTMCGHRVISVLI